METVMKNNRTYLLLAVFAAALLPVMILRDFTPSNELRYLSIADEALRDGHLFAFFNHGVPYADKPPLYLWLVMLGRQLFGGHCMAFLSLFSLVPAMVILRTMDRWAAESGVTVRNRTTAALMLMTSGLFLGLAVFVRMDMLMCMFITLALRSFWLLYTGRGNAKLHRWLFPLFTWLALFTKGPVGLLVPLLSVAVFLILNGQGRLTGRYCGWFTWGVITAGCAVWFTLAWLEGGTDYLNNLLFHQTFDRAVDAFHHKEPVWYYFVTVWYSLAPWSLLVIGGIVVALCRRVRLDESERFFLTVILTTWVMLSLFSSKLAVYLAPTFPFLVYLAASLLQRMPAAAWWQKGAVALPAVVWAAALPTVLLLRHRVESVVPDGAEWLLAAGALTCSGVAALVLLCRDDSLHRAVGSVAAGVLITVFTLGFSLPELNVRLGYGTLCREAKQLLQANGWSNCYVWNIRRAESMDVYLGRPVEETSVKELCVGRCDDGVVMLPGRKLQSDARLRNFVSDRRCHEVGEYLIVELPPAMPAGSW